jgi:hypothetical protein
MTSGTALALAEGGSWQRAILLGSSEEQTMDANAERLTEIVGQFLREAMREAVQPEIDSGDDRGPTAGDLSRIELH